MDGMSETLSLLKDPLPPRSYPSAGTSLEHSETFTNELYGSLTHVDPVLEQLESRHCHSSQSSGDHNEVDKENARRRLYLASAVCLVFIIGEVIGGYLAQSLAIMTDAAHLLTDFATMLVSLFSLWISSRPATKTMNFGWYRSEILGALISVLSIWVVTGVLVYLAVERLISGQYEIKGGVMLITSGCAVAVNIVMGIILHQSGHNHSHNSTGEVRSCGTESNTHGSQVKSSVNPSVRAAFIHVVGDLLQSFGVLVAAYIIYFKPEYKIVDPICTFLFSVLVLVTTVSILRDVLCILMEDDDVNAQAILAEANQRLQSQFDFHSITIQVENYSADMVNCRECQEPKD
ncbi:zinc transporter 2-like isoform X4 [Scyliorhinus canicula]|uniref:zinc transporter 2-like isoform X4 n=1 Tax=Scyliorhinus canicula TaxID=7830 RepID=UPI0018F7A26F|nr:zinc transporter 2-like isoform X4 [Scyliorhinus canicula]